MSKYMTPADAESWQEGVMAGGEDFAPEGMTAYVANLATHTLSADRLEYTVEALYDGHWREPALGYGYRWTDNYDWAAASLAGWRKHHPNEQFRIIARRISPEWVVTDE